MKNPKNKKIVIIALLALTVAAIIFSNRNIDSSPAGMRQVKSFNETGICEAMMPECGICPGEIIGGKCFVNKGAWEQYP